LSDKITNLLAQRPCNRWTDKEETKKVIANMSSYKLDRNESLARSSEGARGEKIA
jgi:hypothetical protein